MDNQIPWPWKKHGNDTDGRPVKLFTSLSRPLEFDTAHVNTTIGHVCSTIYDDCKGGVVRITGYELPSMSSPEEGFLMVVVSTVHGVDWTIGVRFNAKNEDGTIRREGFNEESFRHNPEYGFSSGIYMGTFFEAWCFVASLVDDLDKEQIKLRYGR